jgi:hypothetical protein
MEVLVIGGHSQIDLRLLRLLAPDGRRSRGVIRKSLATTRPCSVLTARPPRLWAALRDDSGGDLTP